MNLKKKGVKSMAYPWQHLSPTDFYSVHTSASSFSAENEKVLLLLYQPIIGQEAFILYKVLQHNETLYSNSQYLPHSTLFTILDLGVKDFYKARIRLEAVGLLKTKRNEINNKIYYNYYLSEPLSAEDFFNESVLRLTLFETLGETNYQRIRHGLKREFFQENEEDGFEDVSRSFTEVFRFNPTPTTLQKDKQIEKSSHGINREDSHIDIDSSSFDWEFFIDKISTRFINKQSLEKREVKNSILTLHNLYRIDELEMENFVLEASDIATGDLELEKLENNIHEAMSQKGQTHYKSTLADVVTEYDQTIRVSEKEQQEELKKQGFNDNEISIIRSSEKNNPMEFLKKVKKAQGTQTTKSERAFVTELVSQTQLKDPVINILIHYVLVQQDKSLFIGENYLYSIVNDWIKKGVDTPESALAQSKKFVMEAKEKKEASKKRQERRNSFSKQPVRKEVLPDWAKEDAADETSGKEAQQMDEETKNKFKERLEKIRKYREGGGNSGD